MSIEQATERVSNSTHWLLFENTGDGEHEVVGCQCGFKASDDDCGHGDSVVDHIYNVGRRAGAAEELRLVAERWWTPEGPRNHLAARPWFRDRADAIEKGADL